MKKFLVMVMAGLVTFGCVGMTALAVDEQETVVTAQADEYFEVVIPATVDFGTIDREMSEKSVDFDVQVKSAFVETGSAIIVQNTTTSENMVMKNNGGTGSITLPFALTQSNGLFTFERTALDANGDATIESTVTCDPANLTAAGAYQGQMVFSITYAPAD